MRNDKRLAVDRAHSSLAWDMKQKLYDSKILLVELAILLFMLS